MRLKMFADGHSPHGPWYRFQILALYDDEHGSDVGDDEFEHMLKLIKPIDEMAKRLFADDFVEIRRELMGANYLEILFKKGTPARRKTDFANFKGWLSLFVSLN